MTSVEEGSASATTPGIGSAGRRVSLVTLDQIIAGASNFLILIWVAHALPAADFGRFSLAFFAFAFVQGALRAVVAWPMVVHPEDADRRPRSVQAAGVLLSGPCGALMVVIGLGVVLADPSTGWCVVVLGVTLPLLMIQDVGRYIAISRGTPGGAIVLDSLWVVLMVAVYAGYGYAGSANLIWYMVGWAGTGALAGLWAIVLYGVPKGRHSAIRWLKLRWDFSWRSFVSATSTASVAMIGSVLMAAVSGPTAVAAVRAALVLERPSSVVQMAVATSAASDVARDRSANRELMVHQRRAMGIALAVAIANVGILVVLPDAFGSALLGSVWPLVKPLVLVIGAHLVAMALQAGVRAALWGRHEAHAVMILDIVSTLALIGGIVAGAAVHDALGAMWGMTIGQAISTVAYWVVLWRHLARTGAPRGRHRG